MRRNTHKTKLDAIEALLKPKPPRPEGLLNEFTGDLKAAYLQAAQAAGGEDGIAGYLYDQAMKDNPSPFMTGLSKLLPLMLEGSKDAPQSATRRNGIRSRSGPTTVASLPRASWPTLKRR